MRVLLSIGVLVLCGASALACDRTDELPSVPGQVLQPSRAVFDPIARETSFDTRAAQEMLLLVNQARAQAGAVPLVLDDALSLAAQAHGREMLQRGILSHQFPGEPDLQVRLGQTGIRFNQAGENVAFDFSAQHAHQSLMASDGHRQNILNPSYNVVGIAVVWAACQMYVVQDFARRLPSYEAGQAEDLIAAKVSALRNQTQLPQLNRVKSSDPGGAACSANQATFTQPAPHLSNARYVLSYSNSEPEALPTSASQLIGNGQTRDFSVAACYARTDQHPNGAYFVTMMFY
jgi:uncharacterized protein YkwD